MTKYTTYSSNKCINYQDSISILYIHAQNTRAPTFVRGNTGTAKNTHSFSCTKVGDFDTALLTTDRSFRKNYVEKYLANRHYQTNESNRYLENSSPKQKTI